MGGLVPVVSWVQYGWFNELLLVGRMLFPPFSFSLSFSLSSPLVIGFIKVKRSMCVCRSLVSSVCVASRMGGVFSAWCFLSRVSIMSRLLVCGDF